MYPGTTRVLECTLEYLGTMVSLAWSCAYIYCAKFKFI
jgi:hypothetical protein